MGLLTTGTPLTWEQTIPYIEYIKEHGIAQFLHLYNRLEARDGDQLKWGDEIEYTLVKFDHENKKVRVTCRAEELLHKLQAEEEMNEMLGTPHQYLWRPEFGSYMIEGTPGVPYGSLIASLNTVEANMELRRKAVRKLLNPDEACLSISFPSLGVKDFTFPKSMADGRNEEAANSIFWPEQAVFLGHPRFKNLTKNIKGRRGSKVAINVPIFQDRNTPRPYVEDPSPIGPTMDSCDAKEDHIYMDHMGFGMGCCCLQVTFQAANVKEARWLYDQLIPITPFLLALSAATPIFRGKLANVDCRWDAISASVDDRNLAERGIVEEEDSRLIKKSRYDSIESYLDPTSDRFNDVKLLVDEKAYQQLVNAGVDYQMAKHISHLFIRDPLQVFEERIHQDDHKSSEHFESLQSSNWNNMRFKPPPIDSPEIGWRVEVRPTEIQLTDFENAAFCCFIILVTRMIKSFQITTLIPISIVHENMRKAQVIDAVLDQKFLFRKDIGRFGSSLDGDEVTEEMTCNEIVNGKKEGFIGLIPLVHQFLDSADIDVETRCSMNQYLEFISKRAKGEIQTLAHWTREFVKHHPAYKQDSDVNDEIVYDLIKKMDSISNGEDHCTKLLGSFRSKTTVSISSAVRKAEEDIEASRQRRGN